MDIGFKYNHQVQLIKLIKVVGLTCIYAAIRFGELMRDLLLFVKISGACPEPGVSYRRQTYNLFIRVLETERSEQPLQSRKHHTGIFDPVMCRPGHWGWWWACSRAQTILEVAKVGCSERHLESHVPEHYSRPLLTHITITLEERPMEQTTVSSFAFQKWPHPK